MQLSNKLLDILVCPKCRGDIILNKYNSGLLCRKCCLVYQIKDGIPIMIIDKAIKYKD